VLLFNGKQISVLHPTLANLYITSLAGDETDLWVGTLNRGVLHWHSGTAEAFSEEQGLPDRQVQSLAISGDRVFVGTAAGVAEFERGRFSHVVAPGLLATALHATPTSLLVGTEDQGVRTISSAIHSSAAVHGKYLVVSDEPKLVASILARLNQKPEAKSALFIAGFSHARERERFQRFTSQLDAQATGGASFGQSENTPPFFSRNMASLSSALSDVSSQKIIVRDAGDKVLQTVTYEWSR